MREEGQVVDRLAEGEVKLRGDLRGSEGTLAQRADDAQPVDIREGFDKVEYVSGVVYNFIYV
jgi:hypothetical protein